MILEVKIEIFAKKRDINRSVQFKNTWSIVEDIKNKGFDDETITNWNEIKDFKISSVHNFAKQVNLSSEIVKLEAKISDITILNFVILLEI